MISLSRIFKANRYVQSVDAYVLEVTQKMNAALQVQTDEVDEMLLENKVLEHQKLEEEAKAILRDAEELAKSIMADASNQAEQLREQARQEIAEWWEQKQKEAEEMAQQTEEMAREEGYTFGQEQGLEQARLEQEENVQKAKDVLTQAYETKEKIIAEAEPFLVELSLDISRKIIHDELTLAPEKVVEIVRQALKSSRSHGEVSILVNHKLYPFVEEHREQLLSLIDGQAELGIYPDYAVEDEGCIIRTAYGSVDAKIDTQLKEIKQILMDVARGSESQ